MKKNILFVVLSFSLISTKCKKQFEYRNLYKDEVKLCLVGKKEKNNCYEMLSYISKSKYNEINYLDLFGSFKYDEFLIYSLTDNSFWSLTRPNYDSIGVFVITKDNKQVKKIEFCH